MYEITDTDTNAVLADGLATLDAADTAATTLGQGITSPIRLTISKVKADGTRRPVAWKIHRPA